MRNTFRDLLLTTHFDYFRNLINEIDDFKSYLKNKNRCVKKAFGTYASYIAIQAIARPLNQIFSYTRYSRETSIDMFCSALNKLQILIGKLKGFYENTDLAKTFQHLYDRLFILLPKDTVFQPSLFDVDTYEVSHKKILKTRGFLTWLREYKNAGCMRRDIQRKHNQPKPLDIIQVSLKLRFC